MLGLFFSATLILYLCLIHETYAEGTYSKVQIFDTYPSVNNFCDMDMTDDNSKIVLSCLQNYLLIYSK